MREVGDLDGRSTGELVEMAHHALGVLASRPVPDSPVACLELAERLGAGLDLGEAALAALVAAADRAGVPSALRYPGTRGWLKSVLGMRTGRANERLTVARQLERLPAVAELVRAGKLSFGYASTIVTAVAHLNDEDCAKAERILLELVDKGVSATHLARTGARIKELIAERDGTEVPPEDGKRADRSWWEVARSLGGGGFTRGWFAPQLMSLIQERLGPLTRPQGPDDDRDHAQRMADALETMLSGGATRWNATLVIKLNSTEDVEPGAAGPEAAGPEAAGPEAAGPEAASGDRTNSDRTEQHPVSSCGADGGNTSAGLAPAMSRRTPGGLSRVPDWPLEHARVSARLADGTPIPSEQARIIALNAGISLLLLGPDGIPLYLGRKARFVSPEQRVVLEALYPTCAFTECDIPARYCEADHVRNWTDGGTTDIDQLAPACAWHNRLKYQHPDWVGRSRDGEGRWYYTIRRPTAAWPARKPDRRVDRDLPSRSVPGAGAEGRPARGP